MADGTDRRAYRRSAIEVPLELSDLHGAVMGRTMGRTVDVSRGGLLAATAAAPTLGSLVRVKVMTPSNEAVMAVGIVVRRLPGQAAPEPDPGNGVAIALTSTSEAWDRFWDDVSGDDAAGGEA